MQYYFADGDQQKGPFPLETLRAQGVKPESLVWRDGLSQWQRADSLPELAPVIAQAPSPAVNPTIDPLSSPQDRQATSLPGYPASPYSPAGIATGNAPVGYQQPGYYGGYAAGPSNGMAVASMIVGILSIPMTFLYCVGLPCGIVAIILGHIAYGKARRGEAAGAGLALAGLICGYVSVLLAVGMAVLLAVAVRYGAVHGH